jgi:hypothetical protein
MVRAGVMTDPLLPPADDPTSPLNSPLMPPGMGGMGGGSPSVNVALQGLMALGQQAAASFGPTPPPAAPAGPSYGFNSATNQFFAKGRVFGADDYQGAVEAADSPEAGGPLPQGFQPLSEQQFGGYVQSIRQPGMGTLMARNFGRGIDQLQMLGGRGLQLIGAEETGQSIVDQQIEDLRKTQPYERQFTDIESGGDAVDWFVANLAQQGPMLLEAIGAGLAGAAIGTVSGGPVGTALGALGGLVAKGAWKQSVLAAARKKAAGETLDKGATKLLEKAAALGGATAVATANSLQMGASDIYGELREQGAGADDFGARLTALAGSIPYAAMDLLPEYVLASRLLSPAAATAGRAARRGDMLRRVGKGALVGGALEGSTETGQEGLLLGLSGQDFSNPENIKRLVNSFAAGAAIGGPIGGLANLKRGAPTDALGTGNPVEPQPGQTEVSQPPPPPPVPGAELDRFGVPVVAGEDPQADAALRELRTEQGTRSLDRMDMPAIQEDTGIDPFEQAYGVPPLALPDYTGGFVPPEGELPLMGGGATPAGSDFRPAQAEMFPVGGLGQAPITPEGGQMELPFATGVNQRPEVQDVLPLETGLPPRFFADQRTQPPASGTVGAANPVLAALQRRMQTTPQFDAAEQERAAQQAAAEQQAPGMAALRRDLTLQQIQPELLAAETALPEVQTSVSPADAAEAWRILAGRGRPKAFEKFLPAIQNQWVDALNMAVAGELTQDDLRQIRTELAQAETIARITKSEPRTVVTGAITPLEPDPKPPTPPKGARLRADQKSKPTAVARTQPAGRGAAKLRDKGTTGEATREAPAAAAQPAAAPRQDVRQPEAPVADKPEAKPVRKAVGPSTTAVERSDMSDSERLAAATEVAETYTKVDEAYEDAIYDIVSVGYFDKLTSGKAPARKALVDKARSFIEDTTFTAKQREVIDRVFTAQIKDAKTEGLSAVSGTDVAPWLQFMIDAGRLEDTRSLRGTVKDIDKIADPVVRDQVAAVLEVKKAPAQVVKPTQESKAVDPASPLATLVRFLGEYTRSARTQEFWDQPFTFEGTTYSYGPRGFAEDMFAEIDPNDAKASYMGTPIRDFFNKDGSLKLDETSRVEIGDKAFVLQKIGGTKGTGRFSLSSFNNPETSMSEGSVKLTVGKFLSKLTTKPKVRVYRNQADFMQRDPALYRKAVAERPQGDFDIAQAAGYSFAGGNVIIFTDRIASEQHLNFVLGHETIGHFGLRGIIPESKFNATMAQVYQSSPHVQADVDAYMAEGMSKEEAVEEYLSDFAGILDTSVVARIWTAIKGALNKLGIKFGDEMVRHLLKHSRSYVREGKSYIHQTDQVFTDMYLVENGYGPMGTGRFSSAGSVRGVSEAIVNLRGTDREMPRDFDGAWREFVSYVGPTARKMDRFASEFLSLQVFRSRKNPGLQRLYAILSETNGIATSVRVRSNERNREIFNAPKDIAEKTGDLMYAAQRLAVSQIKDYRSLNGAPLFSLVDGVIQPNQPEIDRLTKMGMITLEQAKKGFDYNTTDENGVAVTERFVGMPDLKETDTLWKGYLNLRAAMNEVELRLLRARYSATLADRKISFKHFDELVDGKLSNEEQRFVDGLLKKYRDLFVAGTTTDASGNTVLDEASMKLADDFLVAVNKSILNLEDGYTEIAKFFEGKAADDSVAKLRALSARIKLGADKFVVQDRMKQIMTASLSTSQADLFTRRTLATGYTPLLREGAYQLRLQAIDPRTGQPVKLDDKARDQLAYMQMDSEREVSRLANEVNDILTEDGRPKEYELSVFDADAKNFVKRKVYLVASAERALDAVAGPPQLNLEEFRYGLQQLNISLTPAELQRVIVTMTRQDNAARQRLQRGWVPGADRDAVKAVSKHIDSRASTIAKTEMRPYLNELMDLSMRETQLLWQGDDKLLDTLKKEYEATPKSDPSYTTKRREYFRYKYMYEQTNPKGGARRGNEFYNEASRTVQFLNENKDVSSSNFESGAVASQLRSYTSMVQLGGSIATAILNIVGIYTNGLPYLATYNERNGFGGGFGAGAAITQYHLAFRQVGASGLNPAANRAEFYGDMSDADLKRYGLERHEADFIAREIREGSMIPAQTNALVNTSRGRFNSPMLRRIIERWMSPFNVSEQAGRRSLGLAAYRLEFERQTEAGKSRQDAADAARRFAVETLDVTMGEYSVLNRPPAWRGGPQSFLYMYKVYPTTAIQLLANMDRKGQLAMIAALMILSGFQGLPFAEDLEDVIDTIAQALGLQVSSVRFEATKLIESVFPGASLPFMQGWLGMFMPIDVGTRTSLGNVIPGTGSLLAGADVAREIQDVAGPMPAAMLQSAKTVYNALRMPFSDQVTLPDVLRSAPVTMLRATGDTLAFADTGMLIDKRGYNVAGDANLASYAARITGFQPPSLSQQYGAVRVANRITDYQRDVVGSYRTAWVKAKMAGDDKTARNIEAAVREWNNTAGGSALRINNFVGGSQRALREAKRPAGERALRTVPTTNREDIAQVYDLMTLN